MRQRSKGRWANRVFAILATSGALALSERPATANWWDAISYLPGSNALEYSNGQKIITGRYNILHAVYQQYGEILYSNSTDGFTWSAPVQLACGVAGTNPAIASDSYGKLGVVWVDVATDSLYYVSWDGSSWSMPSQVVANGMEPSIVARGSSVHLTWSTGDAVRYATFPTLTPALVAGEVVESTACPGTTFRYPSITLVANPCNPPIPLVGFLLARDEQTSPPGCLNVTTSVGPRVWKRDNTLGTWNLSWSNLRLNSAAGSSVEPVSFSISSRFSWGEVYVGYSDVQNGVPRSEVGHGKGSFWSAPVSISSQRQDVHVRASELSSSPIGSFRVATNTDNGPSDYFDAEYRDGVWAGTGALSWTTPTTLTTGPPAVHPHAHWWRRCSAGTQVKTFVFAEGDLATCTCPGGSGSFLGIEGEVVTPCPNVGLTTLPYYACHKVQLATGVVTTGSGSVLGVDAAEAGVVKALTDRSATITTPSGGTITISWRTGRVVGSWDTGFTLSGATEADLTFVGNKVTFEVVRDGAVGPFDRIPGVCSVR